MPASARSGGRADAALAPLAALGPGGRRPPPGPRWGKGRGWGATTVTFRGTVLEGDPRESGPGPGELPRASEPSHHRSRVTYQAPRQATISRMDKTWVC